MVLNDILESYHSGDFSDKEVMEILFNEELRNEAIEYFRDNPSPGFAKALLKRAVASRITRDSKIGINDNIMYACYLLGLGRQVEDSMLIWEAKNVDFDTFCGVDIQLMVFAGVDRTIEYIDSLHTDEAKSASEYLIKCKDAGDFDDIEAYYSKENLPWWI